MNEHLVLQLSKKAGRLTTLKCNGGVGGASMDEDRGRRKKVEEGETIKRETGSHLSPFLTEPWITAEK